MRPPIVALVAAAALLALVLLLTPGSPAPAAEPPKEPLVKQVDTAITKGKSYLLATRSTQGDWEQYDMADRRGGATALALLALLNAGAEPKEIQKGLAYLRGVERKNTYVVALQTMVYCLAKEDKQRIQDNVNWLTNGQARKMDGKALRGWGYDEGSGRPDASNTQYAVLALHEARLAGIDIPEEVWKSIRDYYINAQAGNGAYGYLLEADARRTPGGQGTAPLLTMTTAGLCGLLTAGVDLNEGRETPNGDGTWKGCGTYVENEKIKNALDWLGKNFPTGQRFDHVPYTYYALYGIERAGRLTGMRFLGEHDWYRVGCEYLVSKQDPREGSWAGGSTNSVVSTSFALLFLSKGRTPILISKLTHDGVTVRDGVRRRRKATDDNNDWNNDRNDARHLVEFTGRELFDRKPMGWQVFNAGEADPSRSADDLAAELLQSPVAYFNGHLAPDFSDKEKDMLKAFASNGGVIFAEACCGKKEFGEGLEALLKDKRLFPEQKLEKLDVDHPVWTASGKFPISRRDRERFPLYGIQAGCKTVVIYSPNDLSCRWESNKYADKNDPDTVLAFHIGANVIAYATGLEPPKPRLTQMELAPDVSSEPKVPRGFLKVGLLVHEGDFNAAAQAMPTLMTELRKSGLDVALKSDEVSPTKAEVANYKFLYIHGRKNFTLPKNRLDDLRFNLEHSGLLFADACCGSKTFDESFRKFLGDLWPDGKYKLEPIPVTDELYSKEVNGALIKTVRCRHETAGRRDEHYQEYEPALEGVKVRGRWAVIYSKYDIGCALEKHKSPGCLGHDYDSAVRLGRAAVLYHLR
jgi:hypothetical protein